MSRSKAKERIIKGRLKEKNYNKGKLSMALLSSLLGTWNVIGSIFLVVILFFLDSLLLFNGHSLLLFNGHSVLVVMSTMSILSILMFHLSLIKVFLYLFGLFSYYTIDDKRLTFVQYGKFKWSYAWDEIDYAQRRYSSSTRIHIPIEVEYYDIVTKNGEKIHFLSDVLKEDLESHVKIVYEPTFQKISNLLWIISVFLLILMHIFYYPLLTPRYDALTLRCASLRCASLRCASLRCASLRWSYEF